MVNQAISGAIMACVSTEVLAEYRDVLSRPKLASVANRTLEILTNLERVAVYSESTDRITESIDDDDNRFLECAEAAAADYLITGNLRHYPETWGSTEVVNARTFLAKLQ